MIRIVLFGAILLGARTVFAQPATIIYTNTAAPGFTVSIPFDFLGDGTVTAAQADIVFDESQLSLAPDFSGCWNSGSGSVAILCSRPATNIVRWQTVSNLPEPLGDAEIGMFTFTIKLSSTGGTFPLRVTNELYTDASGTQVAPAGSTDGSIIVIYDPAWRVMGTVTDAVTHQPIAGARVGGAPTDTQGFYLLTGLGDGAFTAQVQADGYFEKTIHYRIVDFTDVLTIDIELSPGIFRDSFETPQSPP